MQMHAFFTERIEVPGGPIGTTTSDAMSHILVCCSSLTTIRSVSVRTRPGDHTRNCIMDGHPHAVRSIHCVSDYLVSSDFGGNCIFWTRDAGFWKIGSNFNRNGVDATCVRVSPDGLRFCAVYEDGGFLISGPSFETRLAFNLSVGLEHCDWSPDGHVLLLGSSGSNCQVLAFNSDGAYIRKLVIRCLSNPTDRMVALRWSPHGLVVAFGSGRAQIMRGISDESPVLIDCGRHVVAVEWRKDEKVISFGCESCVLFFSESGQHLRTLDLAQSDGVIASIAWLGSDRLVVAAGSILISACVVSRMEKCMTDTGIYWLDNGSLRSSSIECRENGRAFVALRCSGGSGLICALSRQGDTVEAVVMHASGSLVSRRGGFEILSITGFDFNGTHVVVSSYSSAIVWETRTKKLLTISASAPMRISSAPSASNETEDTIVGVATARSTIVLARQSGLLHLYSILDDGKVVFEKSMTVGTRPECIELNCEGTTLAVIDISNRLLLVSLQSGEVFETSRRDCWDVAWAKDAADMLVCADRDKLYVLRGGKPEEPIHMGTNVLIGLAGLEVATLNPASGCVVKFPSKSLRDLTAIIDTVGDLDDAFRFVAQSPHERLWRLLAQRCLLASRIDIADKCFSELQDEQGRLLCGRIAATEDQARQKMEIALWLGRVDEIQQELLDEGRHDLLREMKRAVCDFEGLDDASPQELGDYYFEHGKFEQAVEQYMQITGCEDRLFESLLILNRMQDVSELAKRLNGTDPLLLEVARVLGLGGYVIEAKDAFIKAGHVEMARDVCQQLGRRDLAADVERRFGLGRSCGSVNALLNSGRLEEALDVATHEKGGLDKILEHVHESKWPLAVRKQAAVLTALESPNTRMDAFRNAEGLHMFMLACRQLVEGDFDGALASSSRLASFDSCLVADDFVWRLLAVSALMAGAKSSCSRAFLFLERGDHRYRSLALRIFAQNWTRSETVLGDCPNCERGGLKTSSVECDSCGCRLEYCVASGMPIVKDEITKRCSACHRLVRIICNFENCPLCHQRFN